MTDQLNELVVVAGWVALKLEIIWLSQSSPKLDTFLLNLSGKIVKRIVGLKVQRALEETDYLDLFQYGFKLGYSTETALVTFLII